MRRPDADLVKAELRWVAGLLQVACRLGEARLTAGSAPLAEVPRSARGAIAEALAPLAAQHPALWQQRSRPGGQADSVSRLERTLALLRG